MYVCDIQLCISYMYTYICNAYMCVYRYALWMYNGFDLICNKIFP